MVDVHLYDLHPDTGEQRRIATLQVDGNAVRIDGDEARVRQMMDTLRVLDLDRRETISFADAPERWARFLPGTLRSPYLLATCDQFPASDS